MRWIEGDTSFHKQCHAATGQPPLWSDSAAQVNFRFWPKSATTQLLCLPTCEEGGLPSPLVERKLAVFGIDLDGVATDEFARQDLLRQRVFELRLDRALQRACAVHRIEADVAEQHQCAVGNLEIDLAFLQTLGEIVRLQPRDLADLRLVERMEHHDLEIGRASCRERV